MFSILVTYVALGLVYGFAGLSINLNHPYVYLLIAIEVFLGSMIYAAALVARFNERHGRLPKAKELFKQE